MADLTEFEQTRADGYDKVFAGLAIDPLVTDLYRQAYGEEHPEGIDVFSGCTRGALARALTALRLKEDDVLADLGCGLGGPGRWLARESRTRLVGVDISRVALAAASEAAGGFLEPDRFDYRQGSFNTTGLADESVDGAVSIDAMHFAEDLAGAMAELRRVLRPGARAYFTFTAWNGAGEPASENRRADWSPLISDAGLTLVEAFADHDKFQRWLDVYALWLSHETELRERLGDAAQDLIDEAENGIGTMPSDFVGMEYTVERPSTE